MRSVWAKVLIGVLILSVVAGLVYIFIPKDVSLNVTSLAWERNIRIEEYKTVRESDWYIPSGGRLVYTRQEIKYYEPIYENRAVQKSEQYIAYYETKTEYVDLGNGYMDTRTSSKPVYKTRYYTDYERVKVGENPIYATKYYYDIERWVYTRTATSTGDRKTQYNIEMSDGENDSFNPFWPSTNLKSNERENGRSEYYYVLGYNTKDKNQEIKKYTISYDLWETVPIQTTIKVVVQLGNIKEIKDPEEKQQISDK